MFALQTKEQDLLLPAQKIDAGDEYEGATVIEPIKGYFESSKFLSARIDFVTAVSVVLY